MSKYWFKPKRFGYGATPNTVEGWLVIALFVIYLYCINRLFLPENYMEFVVYLVIGTIVLIAVSKNKTEGNWKFRKNF